MSREKQFPPAAFLGPLGFLLQKQLPFLAVFLVPAREGPSVPADLTLSQESERLRAAGGFKIPSSDQLCPSLLWA